MLAPQVVAEIKRFLAEGTWSQRKIARHLSVSRGIVGAIANGKRPERRKTRYVGLDFVPPTGAPERCPRCGALVIRPCVACQLDWLSLPEEAPPFMETRPQDLLLRESKRCRPELGNERRCRSAQNDAGFGNREGCNGSLPLDWRFSPCE